MNKNQSINEYNFLELLDSAVNEKEKSETSFKINEIIWKEFLITKLEKIINDEDKEIINNMSTDGKDIIEFIINKYPDVKDVLWKIAEKVKKEILLGSIDTELSEIQSAEKFVKKEDLRNAIQKKKLLFVEAKKFATEEKWEKLRNLFLAFH